MMGFKKPPEKGETIEIKGTICPVGNATCLEFLKVEEMFFNEKKECYEPIIYKICPLSCTVETCILNK